MNSQTHSEAHELWILSILLSEGRSYKQYLLNLVEKLWLVMSPSSQPPVKCFYTCVTKMKYIMIPFRKLINKKECWKATSYFRWGITSGNFQFLNVKKPLKNTSEKKYLWFLLSNMSDYCQTFMWYFKNTEIGKQIVNGWLICQFNDAKAWCLGNADGITLFQILNSEIFPKEVVVPCMSLQTQGLICLTCHRPWKSSSVLQVAK